MKMALRFTYLHYSMKTGRLTFESISELDQSLHPGMPDVTAIQSSVPVHCTNVSRLFKHIGRKTVTWGQQISKKVMFRAYQVLEGLSPRETQYLCPNMTILLIFFASSDG